MESDFTLDQILASPVEGESFIRLAGGEGLPFAAGQIWLGVYDSLVELLPTVLVPGMDETGEWALAGSIPASWQPGSRLRLRGPLGGGFTLPRSVPRVACVSLDERVYTLIPLLYHAIGQAAEVVYCGENSPLRLPEQVEVFALHQWEEWWKWADYVAVQGTLSAAATFFKEVETKYSLDNRHKKLEVMIRQPIFCGGMAECGVCAVPIRKGWLLICQNGAVLDASQIEWSSIEE